MTRTQIAMLDEVTKPALNFPADINAHLSPGFIYAGATVDGQATQALPLVTASSVRY
ncbi:hypothetical protein GNZ12_38890 [Paraburkholderia sp. 1N]|uniref:Uncharacterized protein n=1 Tax=Paraburkholderia solitsugae TaxID=2675748 RepID=A0ABX2C4A7_9BURK|nr:hypothetical protein [Paraburkholderia solitsugae]NPT47158.1 hypothetical protein [Paraburkholderia solitsugae]